MGEQLLDELQDSVIQMRTLPLSTITASYPRAIRDLATEEKKKVELSVSGDETQLDRVILTGISETIVHVLRNAVAHGIEAPKERKAAKKDPTGRVELRAEPRGRMVAIRVIDDGRGVSPELAARAEKEGSLAEILAETGFSTAEQVTDVAGRGVGLDAVKRHVEDLGGGLEVQSEPGARDRGDDAAAGHPGADEGSALRARRPPVRAADDQRRPGRLGRRDDLARKSPGPGSRGRGGTALRPGAADRSVGPATGHAAARGRRRIARPPPRAGLRRAARRGRGRDQEPRRGPVRDAGIPRCCNPGGWADSPCARSEPTSEGPGGGDDPGASR